MVLSGYSSLSSCSSLSCDGFDKDAKVRSVWIHPDEDKIYYSNEVDSLKALEKSGWIDDVKEKMPGIKWNKFEKLRKQTDDVAYAAKKLGYMWIMCFFNNVTIESNVILHLHTMSKKLLVLDIISSLCNEVEFVTYYMVLMNESRLFKTYDEFENAFSVIPEFPNEWHRVGFVFHHDRRSPNLKYYHRRESYIRQWGHLFDDYLKRGYDWIEHATHDVYHPYRDLGRPQQDRENYDENGRVLAMPLSVAISDKKSYCYMTDAQLSKLTKEKMDAISKTIVYGPYEPLKWAINQYNAMVDLTYWPPLFKFG